MKSKELLIQTIILILGTIGIIFSFTTSTNLVYGASGFSVQPPTGWSYQENEFGYKVTSPDNKFYKEDYFFPNERLSNLYSTTNTNEILNKIVQFDSSGGNIEHIYDPYYIGDVLAAQYYIGPYHQKALTLAKANPGMFVTSYVGNPDTFSQYYDIAVNIPADFSFAGTPAGQKITSDTDQINQNTLTLGPKMLEGTVEINKEHTQRQMEYCSNKLGYDTQRTDC